MIHLRSVMTGAVAGAVALGAALLALPATATAGVPLPAATATVSAPATPAPSASPAGSTVSWAWLRTWLVRLTDDQRQCLAQLELPRPQNPTAEQLRQWRQEAVAAAEKCGVVVSARPVRAALLKWWRSLTPTQRTCLKNAGLTRPVGPLTKAERQEVLAAVKAAAHTCGIPWPPK